MFQGTGSDVGKSVIVAGLCRLLSRRGIRVAPFKSQNMSNNAAVADGGEIGRAQALQARAAGLSPTVHMNPVLLKPEGKGAAQLIVQGRRAGVVRASDYRTAKARLLPAVMDSFRVMANSADLVLVEGAGSASETNLRDGDIANMGFAEAASIPVAVIGDIDRGGVIASVVGTHTVLSEADRGRVKAFVVNKLRGEKSLFDDGVRTIAAHTAWAPLGVVPWLDALRLLPAEDSLGLPSSAARLGVRKTIAVLALPHIANFDDLDPLRLEPEVDVVVVQLGTPIPAAADLVIVPGSKSTIADLAALRGTGWDVDIRAHLRRGGRVLGLCGGFQMLGQSIADPEGIEGPPATIAGLGLLAVDTVLHADKVTTAVSGRHVASGEAVVGYEIHLGRTEGHDRARPLVEIGGRFDGASSTDGLVTGTYIHGLFAADGFRRAFLAELGVPSRAAYEATIETVLDALADHLEAHMDIERLLAIAGYAARTRSPATPTMSVRSTAAAR
jgi:adenosylcobyric acid synthase